MENKVLKRISLKRETMKNKQKNNNKNQKQEEKKIVKKTVPMPKHIADKLSFAKERFEKLSEDFQNKK